MKKKIEKKVPNFDTTYCVSKECETRCWRHITNYEFAPGGLYWYQERCEKVEKNEQSNV